MNSFYALGIWICLSEFKITVGISGYTGGHVVITCSHSWASSNKKYFCRDPCGDRDILVRSDRSPEGRFTLRDYGNGTFTVTITDLQESDSGIYKCGVERVGKDTYQRVSLTVSKGESWNTQSSITKSSFSSTSPSPDDISTNTSSTTEFQGPVVSSKPAQTIFYESTQSDPLMFTAVSLSVMVVLSGGALCIWKMHIRKSHTSVDAQIQDTTETVGDYEEVRNVTIYSTVNPSPAANQIHDPPLYSTLTI